MSGFELLDVNRFVLGLQQDAALQALFPGGAVVINAKFAPRQPPDVHMVFDLLTDHEANSLGGNRVFCAPTYSVQCIGKEVGYDVIGPIMTRADAVLTAEDASRQVGSTWVGRFVRVNTLMDANSIDNVRWYWLGGVYEAIAFDTR